jgi:hypothetical protein
MSEPPPASALPSMRPAGGTASPRAGSDTAAGVPPPRRPEGLPPGGSSIAAGPAGGARGCGADRAGADRAARRGAGGRRARCGGHVASAADRAARQAPTTDDRQLADAVEQVTTPVAGLGRRSLPIVRAQLLAWAVTAHAAAPDRPLSEVLADDLVGPHRADVAPSLEGPLPPVPGDVGEPEDDLTDRLTRLLARRPDLTEPGTPTHERAELARSCALNEGLSHGPVAADPSREPVRESVREPSVSPHEAREFTNAVEYTIQLTFVVAGGARWRTAHARARNVAERLANTAARAKGVVDVRAVAGASHDGELLTAERACFDAANAGHGTGVDPTRLDRSLDPDHERALASLAEANATARVRRQADFDRRLTIGCGKPAALGPGLARPCRCAYCRPAEHLELPAAAHDAWVDGGRCLCGRPSTPPAFGCRPHDGQQLVVLDGDPPELARLAARITRSRAPASAKAGQVSSRSRSGTCTGQPVRCAVDEGPSPRSTCSVSPSCPPSVAQTVCSRLASRAPLVPSDTPTPAASNSFDAAEHRRTSGGPGGCAANASATRRIRPGSTSAIGHRPNRGDARPRRPTREHHDSRTVSGRNRAGARSTRCITINVRAARRRRPGCDDCA